MKTFPYARALIVGSGAGLSASLARQLSHAGAQVTLAARNTDKLADLSRQINARTYACDASDRAAVANLCEELDRADATPDLVIFNPSARARGPIAELDPHDVERALAVGALGGFLVAQQAVRRMLPKGHGAVVFTGASASVKGFALSAPFAMAKFALRGLAQSMARELHPKGIHIGHFVIDGGIRSAQRIVPTDAPDSLLDPEAIAQSYLDLLRQPRNAWTWEVELRPWVERF